MDRRPSFKKPLPDTTIGCLSKRQVFNSCTVTAMLVQTLNEVTANKHHRRHYSLIQRFFLSKLETPSGEIKVARRSQQIWRDKESLCLTASFIAELFAAAFHYNAERRNFAFDQVYFHYAHVCLPSCLWRRGIWCSGYSSVSNCRSKFFNSFSAGV